MVGSWGDVVDAFEPPRHPASTIHGNQQQFLTRQTKKIPAVNQNCRVPLFLKATFKSKKAKGEEKPEEELMGKRKSSPRLATTSRKGCCYY